MKLMIKFKYAFFTCDTDKSGFVKKGDLLKELIRMNVKFPAPFVTILLGLI